MATAFEQFLAKFPENEWFSAADVLAPSAHEVDRNAFRIWFRFFPLGLLRYLEGVEDRDATIHKMAIQGDFELKNQIDSSHGFLYGHRYWSHVKTEIEGLAGTSSGEGSLSDVISKVAEAVAAKAGASKDLTIGISAVGLMTLNQVGLEAFKAAKGEVQKPSGELAKSPDAIVADRKKDDSQGIFGFLKSVNKRFTVKWMNSKSTGSFGLTYDADIATASAEDRSRNWQAEDERCWEGVVPVECRSAACGTCWVGVLGGEEKLSDVQRLERKQMSIFGYNQPGDSRPYMRLACQAKAFGNVTMVIPPWNGVFGRKVYGVEDTELIPATTSAKKLRETIATAMKDGAE